MAMTTPYQELKVSEKMGPHYMNETDNKNLAVADQRTHLSQLVTRPQNVEDMFANGVKRYPGEILTPPAGRPILELGQGNNPVPGTVGLAWPEWRAPLLYGYSAESVSAIHAHHFMEHLDFEEASTMISEMNRVLVPHGVVYITVPHAQSAIGYGSADHRTFWTEKTWQTFFYSLNYDAQFGLDLELNISYMSIAGINFHELMLLVQLVKDRNHVSPWRKK